MMPGQKSTWLCLIVAVQLWELSSAASYPPPASTADPRFAAVQPTYSPTGLVTAPPPGHHPGGLLQHPPAFQHHNSNNNNLAQLPINFSGLNYEFLMDRAQGKPINPQFEFLSYEIIKDAPFIPPTPPKPVAPWVNINFFDLNYKFIQDLASGPVLDDFITKAVQDFIKNPSKPISTQSSESHQLPLNVLQAPLNTVISPAYPGTPEFRTTDILQNANFKEIFQMNPTTVFWFQQDPNLKSAVVEEIARNPSKMDEFKRGPGIFQAFVTQIYAELQNGDILRDQKFADVLSKVPGIRQKLIDSPELKTALQNCLKSTPVLVDSLRADPKKFAEIVQKIEASLSSLASSSNTSSTRSLQSK